MTIGSSELEFRRAACDRKDILGMQVLSPLSSAYLPWSISAMRPSGVVAVVNEILVNRRRNIVELGGGVSTCYIARLLAYLDAGHLLTVEHDDLWADFLEEQLARENLQHFASVIRVPLVPINSTWPDEELTWYQQERLTLSMTAHPIDLLLIDGPPAYQANRTHARYPAVPFFAPLFAEDYAVILDDIDRTGEQDIMRLWENDFGITFEHRLIDGGVGIGRPRPAFSV